MQVILRSWAYLFRQKMISLVIHVYDEVQYIHDILIQWQDFIYALQTFRYILRTQKETGEHINMLC